MGMSNLASLSLLSLMLMAVVIQHTSGSHLDDALNDPVCSHVCNAYPSAMCFRYCRDGRSLAFCHDEEHVFYLRDRRGGWRFVDKKYC